MIRSTQGQFSPRVWRGGAAVVLAVGAAAGAFGVYPGAAPAHAAFPGRNGKIVFDRYLRGSAAGEKKALFIVDPKTKRLRKLIAADAREPAWSPNGRQIVFVRRLHGPGGPTEDDIFTANANGTHLRRLTRTQAGELDPSWSPNGTWIVFARSAAPRKVGQPPGPAAIYKMQVDGTHVRRLTGPDGNVGPVWSPNGKKIAFWSYGAGIFTMNPDGSEHRKLTNNGLGLDWSPNGKKIAFQRNLPHRSKIFVMTATGTRVHMLGPKTALNGVDPAWSPDGKQIAFLGQNKPGVTAGIYRMNADGTHPVRLTVAGTKGGDYGATDGSPDWQPLPG